jgi:hypothetical protein
MEILKQHEAITDLKVVDYIIKKYKQREIIFDSESSNK